MVFLNRTEAGKLLVSKIENFKDVKNLIVLGIPRGGVVVGKPLAKFLRCPLDVIVTKKIGAPSNSELAIGAVGVIGEPIINEKLAASVGADDEYFKKKIPQIKKEVTRREKKFRQGKLPLVLKNKTVIITDDGVATGATMMAAIEVARQQNPKKIIIAVPVIARDTLTKVEELADEVIYLDAPALFFAVGQFYKRFDQVSDKEVVELLK